jgi:hypothetical protein
VPCNIENARLDIDDTVDVVHGHQQLAQWNAHYDERCFLPIHVYDAATGAPVVVILRKLHGRKRPLPPVGPKAES